MAEKKESNINVTENEDENVLEIEYPKASFSKRLIAAIFDMVLFSIVAFMLYSYGFSYLTMVMPGYMENVETFTGRKAESKLFSDFYGDNDSTLITDYYRHEIAQTSEDDKMDKYWEANDAIETALTSFYTNPSFYEVNNGIETYNLEKIPAHQERGTYFLYSEDGSIVRDSTKTGEEMYEFYQAAVNSALNYLYKDSTLINSSRVITYYHISMIALAIVISGSIFYLMFPFIFKKNRQTLGKLIFKLGVISADGLRPSGARTFARFAAFFGIEVLVSLVSFALPLIVSFSMFAFSKTGTSLHDYITNTYVVDISTYSIYKSVDDLKESDAHERDFDIKPKDVIYRK